MKDHAAVKKWGIFAVTLKRADELEVGDKVLSSFEEMDVIGSIPYKVKSKKIKKFPDWIVTIHFTTSGGEDMPINFKKQVATNHLFPVIIW
jgi:hypothetical protein